MFVPQHFLNFPSETDVMDQFLDPKTDIIGEGSYINEASMDSEHRWLGGTKWMMVTILGGWPCVHHTRMVTIIKLSAASNPRVSPPTIEASIGSNS